MKTIEAPTPARERGIIFSGPMIRALLAGRKTMTRRVVSRVNSTVDGSSVRGSSGDWRWNGLDFAGATARDKSTMMEFIVGTDAAPLDVHLRVPFPEEETFHRVRPIWEVGDRLWVRETWLNTIPANSMQDGPCARRWVRYAATEPAANAVNGRPWRPSIYMPRWASRITLEVTNVRVERLTEISAGDAMDEGITIPLIAQDDPYIWRIFFVVRISK